MVGPAPRSGRSHRGARGRHLRISAKERPQFRGLPSLRRWRCNRAIRNWKDLSLRTGLVTSFRWPPLRQDFTACNFIGADSKLSEVHESDHSRQRPERIRIAVANGRSYEGVIAAHSGRLPMTVSLFHALPRTILGVPPECIPSGSL